MALVCRASAPGLLERRSIGFQKYLELVHRRMVWKSLDRAEIVPVR